MSQLFPASPLRAAALAALCVAALPQSALATNGYFSHGYGVKSQAIAGVGIALPQDGLTAATNPAGTAFTGNRLDVGVNLFNPSRSSEITGNGAGLNGKYSADGRDLFLIPEFGYTRQIDPQLSFGLAVYGNGGMNTSYDTSPFSALGEAGPTKMNLEQLFISPSVAWKATPNHVFGAALNLAHQRFSIRGLTPFAQAGFSSAPDNVHNQGTDTSNGAGVRLGWIGQITPELRLGATWASKIQGRFDKYKGLFAEQGGFDIPANYGVGLSWQPAQNWTLGLDYQVIELSDVKSVGNPLSKLVPGVNQLGDSDGPGFGWKDVKVVKLGVIHQLNDAWTLRAGYSHATQPIPKSETFFNVLAPGVVQDHLTAGFTWKASANSEWSAHYSHALEKTVKGSNSMTAFGNGETNIRLKEDIIGVSYGWKF
ncbi:MAG: outer membrane protein transport protein [Aquabacterium sp.]|uniref:OmpP1/FadL family transporter n=1 Tax=Aquabacterium sp. TaxID=1872578 RepID=UPI002A3721B7|nr:outer membrane protein transport protein [Aquabacterium sp.]MDX9842553.1 outer membrane protein transport protein [Aquabacterium sp.]